MILQGMGIGTLIQSGIGILSEEELIVGINRGLCFIAEQQKGPKLSAAKEGGSLSRRSPSDPISHAGAGSLSRRSPMRIDIRW